MVDTRKNSSKYLPCLLTRLTDERPFATRDTTYGTEFSLEQLKHDILVNLGMLLNSHTAPAATRHLEQRYPLAAASSFHFGIDSYAGLTGSFNRPGVIAEAVRRAIVHFEPRLAPESVQVQAEPGRGAHDHAAIHLNISSRLAVHPLSEDMYFRLRVDVETGESTINPGL